MRARDTCATGVGHESVGRKRGGVLMTDGTNDSLAELIAQSLTFQRKWQRLSMVAYVVSTVGVLICTTGGTYAAAQENAKVAAVLAAVATILIGLEKSLLFREKWKFHLGMATR